MSVGGTFDPGSGDLSDGNPDIVSGTFIALPGSSVTTNTATWEVLSGGLVDVKAGASFTVAAGGTLDTTAGTLERDAGSTFVVYGTWLQ
jgi:hypothetical protein